VSAPTSRSPASTTAKDDVKPTSAVTMPTLNGWAKSFLMGFTSHAGTLAAQGRSTALAVATLATVWTRSC